MHYLNIFVIFTISVFFLVSVFIKIINQTATAWISYKIISPMTVEHGDMTATMVEDFWHNVKNSKGRIKKIGT